MKRKQMTQMILLAWMMVTMFLLTTAAASAQSTTMYPVKFVCGFRPGNVPLLNDLNPDLKHYEDVKPGNYATTINIVNLNLIAQNVYRYVVLDGDSGGPYPIATRFLGPFDAEETSCPEIYAALPPGNSGVIKGYVVLLTLNDGFKTNGVYSYSSQNAFERHIMWQYNPFGVVQAVFGLLNLTIGGITNPILPDLFYNLEAEFATASGAGGLGLGASIDVEMVPPKEVAKSIDEIMEVIGVPPVGTF